MNCSLQPRADGRQLIIAHRGGAAEALENSLAAFQRVIDLAFDGMECDVRLAADGVPVIAHDPVVGPSTDGAFPTLAAMLGLPWRPGQRLMIEVKPSAGDDATGAPDGSDAALARAVAVAIGRSRFADQAVVASFSPAILTAVAAAGVGLPLMALLDTGGRNAAEFAAAAVSAFGIATALATPERVAALGRGGRPVWCWTVNDPKVAARLTAAGVAGVITDHPSRLTALRG